MWNWSTRLFLTEARQNLTIETEADLPSKWTKEELDGLEKTLKEHEVWLNTWVEKQKSVKSYENPVIETTEMKARAKVLEGQLAKLARRRIPKAKKTTTSTSASSTAAATTTNAAESGETSTTAVPADNIHNDTKAESVEQEEIPVDASQKQVPLQQHRPVDEIRDEL